MKDLGFKLVLTLVGVLIAGIPTWLYLIMSSLLDPEGFWQKLVVMGLGLYVLGGIQFFLGIALLVWLYHVWLAD
jgi:hypothetical protein